MKKLALVVLLLGIYQVVALLWDTIPALKIIEGAWLGWVIGVALLAIAGYLYMKPAAF